MTKVYIKALSHFLETKRTIGDRRGENGPTLVFFGGIHGNEPSGVYALHRVFKELEADDIPIRGRMIGLSGNLSALRKGQRFNEEDLNRMWTQERLAYISTGDVEALGEDDREMKELKGIIDEVLTTDQGPFYFIDLHTTSSETQPFLTVNDSLLNRKFTGQYPVPMILGIEEYLQGPLLSYLNELGYVAFGFESGQHDALSAIHNHIAFIYLSMYYTGMLHEDYIAVNPYVQQLEQNTFHRGAYEIFMRYMVRPDEDFKMKPGFSNFQAIRKGEVLARSDGEVLKAPRSGRVFMPLYQDQGEDGYFIIRKIAPFFMKLSAFLRRIGLYKVLPFLPGVSVLKDGKGTLKVDLRIDKYYAKEFFHLLGYRSRELGKDHLLVSNREAASRNEDYVNAPWVK